MTKQEQRAQEIMDMVKRSPRLEINTVKTGNSGWILAVDTHKLLKEGDNQIVNGMVTAGLLQVISQSEKKMTLSPA